MRLPAIMAPSDIVAALGAVAEAVGAGELSPEEGAAVAGILEAQRRAVETVEMEAQIAASLVPDAVTEVRSRDGTVYSAHDESARQRISDANPSRPHR